MGIFDSPLHDRKADTALFERMLGIPLAVAMFCIFVLMVLVERSFPSSVDQGTDVGLRYLPYVYAPVLFLLWRRWRRFRQDRPGAQRLVRVGDASSAVFWIAPVTLVPLFLATFVGSAIAFFNGATGPQHVERLAGTVTGYTSGRYVGRVRINVTLETGEHVSVHASRAMIAAARKGDRYTETFTRGSLGLLYQRARDAQLEPGGRVGLH